MPAALEAARLELARGRVVPRRGRTGSSGWATPACPMVTDVAQYSVRGGIVDVYGFGMTQPARAEFWDDACVALRAFDLSSQRSTGPLERVTVLPVDPRAALDEGARVRRSLLDLLPAGTLVVEEDGAASASRTRCAARGPRRSTTRTWRGGSARRCRRAPSCSCRAGGVDSPRAARFARLAPSARRTASGSRWCRRPTSRATSPGCGRRTASRRWCCATTRGSSSASRSCWARAGASPSARTLAVGALDGGFAIPGLAVFTDHEMFRRARRIRRPRRYRQASPLGAVAALKPGDAVVHLEHGIGIYRGLQTIAVGDGTLDVAAVEYHGGDLLHVPLYRIDQLERYRGVDADGAEAPVPRLDHLGGKRWARVRRQAEESVHRMAAELLDLYARRKLTPGFAFPPDTKWQRELESSFLYEDTPDQRRATDGGEGGHGAGAADGPAGRRRRRATARPRSRCARPSRR